MRKPTEESDSEYTILTKSRGILQNNWPSFFKTTVKIVMKY